MKKYLLILVLLVSCSATADRMYSTTWAGTASNQELTKMAFNDGINTTRLLLAYSGFAANTLQLIRKDTLLARCNGNLNTSYPSLSAKTSSQIVAKRDITLVLNVQTVTSSSTCTSTSGSQTLYFDVVLSHCYTDAALTTSFVGNGQWYYCPSIGYSLSIGSAGRVYSIVAC